MHNFPDYSYFTGNNFFLLLFNWHRIIPFVAADAVVGDPEADLDDDERLNPGGVSEQRNPISLMAPFGDQSSTAGIILLNDFPTYSYALSAA